MLACWRNNLDLGPACHCIFRDFLSSGFIAWGQNVSFLPSQNICRRTIKKKLNLSGWHWFIGSYRFQGYVSMIHDLYIALCAGEPFYIMTHSSGPRETGRLNAWHDHTYLGSVVLATFWTAAGVFLPTINNPVEERDPFQYLASTQMVASAVIPKYFN